MALFSTSAFSEASLDGPLQEPEEGAGDTNEEVSAVWQCLLPELKEEVCARLRLAHMARAALVSKSWASTYASCLASRQQQLKALAPSSAICAVQASLDAWKYIIYDDDFTGWDFTDSILDQLEDPNFFNVVRRDESNNYTACLVRDGVTTTWSGPCGAKLVTTCYTTQFGPRKYDMGTLMITLEFELETAESLPWVVGLLLKLAQEVLPKVCGGEMREEKGPRIVMKVRCQVEGETGWEDWAPLAPLCRAVRLTVMPPTAPPVSWKRTKYAVIAQSPRGWGSIFGMLHIKARWWEPVSCWSLGAGPHPSGSVSPDNLPDKSARGPHDADAAIPEHAEVPCTSHLGRIDQDDFDGWDEFFFDGE